MKEWLIDALQSIPPELATAILAMVPITELRVSIPVGITFYGLAPWSAFLWSVLGDVIPALVIVWFLGPVVEWLRGRWRALDQGLQWWFRRVDKNFGPKYKKYGALALMLFVAIPLPVTGAWTGAAASWLFGIPKRLASIYIGFGVILAGLIVTAITTGVLYIV